MDEIITAARNANIHNFIESLPHVSLRMKSLVEHGCMISFFFGQIDNITLVRIG